jgi:archaetidylinositol phosphate synthase
MLIMNNPLRQAVSENESRNEMQLKEIDTHERINDILLGPLERPALKWLAAHMPRWINPDMLTGIGVLGAVLILIGYGLSNFSRYFLWLASLGFVINWYGDSLDGTLARYRQIQRPKYGFFVDHTVDAFNEALIFIGLGLSPYVRIEIALIALVSYLLMSILVYVRTCVEGVFKISYGKLGPTEARVIAITAHTLVFFNGNPVYQIGFVSLSLYDLIGAGVAVLLFWFFVTSTLSQARELANVD